MKQLFLTGLLIFTVALFAQQYGVYVRFFDSMTNVDFNPIDNIFFEVELEPGSGDIQTGPSENCLVRYEDIGAGFPFAFVQFDLGNFANLYTPASNVRVTIRDGECGFSGAGEAIYNVGADMDPTGGFMGWEEFFGVGGFPVMVGPGPNINADFTSSVQSGNAPLEVQFEDLSCGEINFWEWDFGDGNFSTEQNPVHTYLQAGSYTVKLLALSVCCYGDIVVKENYITVTQNPNPVFRINPESHNFGYTLLNTTKTLPVTVTNYGLADLIINNILPSTNRYSVSLPEKDLGFILGSMESKVVNIHFTLDELSEISGQIIFFTNDPVNSMYSLPVTGIGALPEITTETDEIDFGLIYLTSQSGDSLIVIENTGLVDLTIQSLTFTENSNAFVFAYEELGNPIAPNETASIYIRFYPPITGTFEDTLLIVNNSQNEPNLTISLSGTCTYAKPKEPENVQISIGENNAVITWDAVTENIYNQVIVPDGYIVLYNEIPDDENYFWFLAFVSDGLTCTHYDVAHFRNFMFYKVVAYIEQERGDLEKLLQLSKTNEKQKWLEMK
jgi:PKD repeat protein